MDVGLVLVQQAAQRVREREADAERETRLEASKTAPGRPNGRDPGDLPPRSKNALRAFWCVHGRVQGGLHDRRGHGATRVRPRPDRASHRAGRPELPTRKAGHEADYVARTVKAVFNHPEVVKHQQEQAKEAQQRSSRRERDSGPSLAM